MASCCSQRHVWVACRAAGRRRTHPHTTCTPAPSPRWPRHATHTPPATPHPPNPPPPKHDRALTSPSWTCPSCPRCPRWASCPPACSCRHSRCGVVGVLRVTCARVPWARPHTPPTCVDARTELGDTHMCTRLHSPTHPPTTTTQPTTHAHARTHTGLPAAARVRQPAAAQRLPQVRGPAQLAGDEPAAHLGVHEARV
jgi:hypothetical protein